MRYATRRSTITIVNDPALARDMFASHDFIRSRILQPILGDGLIAANGPAWERQRRAALPDFRPARIDTLVATFRTTTSEHATAWFQREAAAASLDLTRALERIALANVSRSLFDADLDESFLDAFAVVLRDVGSISNSSVLGTPIIRTPDGTARLNAAMATVEEAVQRIIDRLRSGQTTAEISAMITDPFSPRQVRDTVLTMLFAESESTALVLGWAWYVLLTKPDIATRLRAEVDSVLGDRPITAADVPRLTTTRRFIDETLRLYPPIWLVTRQCVRTARLGPYEMPANGIILVSPFLLHRRAASWPDANRFDPERFADPGAHEDGSYIPFISGRHLCIGRQFAITELVAVLVTLVQRVTFELLGPPVVRFDPGLSLRMREPLRVAVRPRDCPAVP